MPITARAFQVSFAALLLHGTWFIATASAAERRQQLSLEPWATAARPSRPVHYGAAGTPACSTPSNMGARVDSSTTPTAQKEDTALGSQGLQPRDRVQIVIVQVRRTLHVSCRARARPLCGRPVRPLAHPDSDHDPDIYVADCVKTTEQLRAPSMDTQGRPALERVRQLCGPQPASAKTARGQAPTQTHGVAVAAAGMLDLITRALSSRVRAWRASRGGGNGGSSIDTAAGSLRWRSPSCASQLGSKCVYIYDQLLYGRLLVNHVGGSCSFRHVCLHVCPAWTGPC